VRVEVSADAGRTWQVAELGEGSQQPLNRAWAWTFWSAALALPSDLQGSATQVSPTLHTLHTTHCTLHTTHYTHTHTLCLALPSELQGAATQVPPTLHTLHTPHTLVS
jgi:hypothetical protein